MTKKGREVGLQPIGEILRPMTRSRGDEQGGMQSAGAIIKSAPAIQKLFDDQIIRPEDLAYTHSIFVQCFMPLRHNKSNEMEWETGNRSAKPLMSAGRVIKPDSPGEFKRCQVPAGPKARIVAAYINDFAFHHKTPVVDLGKSMRKFMEKAGIKVGGKNGLELQRELENFAAAKIVLGVWTPDGSAHQEQVNVSRRLSFWIERHEEQMAFWRPEMQLSDDYFQALISGNHIAPIYWEGNLKLQHRPRAMDILNFLTYRLRKPLAKPVRLKIETLHAMFGQDCKRVAHFWPRFIEDLKAAHTQYRTAHVEVTPEGLILHSSPALIPYRKMVYLGGT